MLGGVENATQVTLLTGSQNAASRKDALALAASGQAGIVIGTHALLSESVAFADLGLIVVDEHHRFGAFPKPGLYTKMFKKMFSHLPMIFLSGTPCPESYSQMYHQFWVSDYSPFREYKNFYRWADDYVIKFDRVINGFKVTEYSNGREIDIMTRLAYLMISHTQQQSGFETSIEEEVLYVDMSEKTKMIVKKLERDLVVEGKEEVILADTPVKLMQKVHQLCSGTVKFESGNSMVIDTTKAEFIRSRFATNNIGIFYKFKAELKALKQVYGDQLTEISQDHHIARPGHCHTPYGAVALLHG
jgi:hypothetical protein